MGRQHSVAMPDVVQLNQRWTSEKNAHPSMLSSMRLKLGCAILFSFFFFFFLFICSIFVTYLSFFLLCFVVVPPVAVSAALLSTCHAAATPSTFTCTSHPVTPIVSLTIAQHCTRAISHISFSRSRLCLHGHVHFHLIPFLLSLSPISESTGQHIQPPAKCERSGGGR